MSAATQIAAKDLKLRIRDRSVFILGLVAPLALALIFNAIFGNTFTTGQVDLNYGLVDLDGSHVSESFGDLMRQIAADGTLEVTEFETKDQADKAVEDGDVDAYVLLSPGLEEAALAGDPYTIEVVGDIDEPTSTQVATSIAQGFGSRIGAAQLAVVTSFGLISGPPPGDAATWGEEAAQAPPAYSLADVSADTRQLDGPTYFAAGMAVFFLFFTVQFGVVGLLEEERQGTMARLLAAPITRSSVIAGKAILSFLLGIVSMMVLVVSTALLMGADWGPPLGVGLLVTTGVLAAVSVMGLVAAFARTPEGAGNLGSIVAVILGMLGGTFFPIGQGDDLLSKLSYLTPHAWFIRGLGDISGGASWTAALPAAGAMLLFAVVLGGAGWMVLARRFDR
ncbi:MAG: ABC transporter permease [Acidimicrobiia bacterium]